MHRRGRAVEAPVHPIRRADLQAHLRAGLRPGSDQDGSGSAQLGGEAFEMRGARPVGVAARTPVRDVLEPAATRNCPHSDQPITIVVLLATPEAAPPVIRPAHEAPPLQR
ncbi:hypothetical protein ABT263_37515 [Kitasatospora sp. NPDC001603]|uniref:hypothetical protein n=1 Tax=Kitasatospora sp. NPDC001603 TaxID=3154388 RepID=UPI0033233A8B